jgi:molecular chaperone HtpG
MQDEKFDEMMRRLVLFKNSENKLVTLEDYQGSIPDAYREKLKEKYVYFEKSLSDESLRKQLLSERIQVLETDQYIDPHFMQHCEYKKVGEESIKFVAIDSIIENLLDSSETSPDDIKIKDFFKQVLVGDNKDIEAKLEVDVKSLKNSSSSAYFKVDENMKRFQQMTKSMGQSSFSLPLKKTLIINPRNALIQNALKIWEKGEKKELAEKICYHVQDLASLSSEGLSSEEKERFVNRSQSLVQELSQYIL